MSLQVWLPLNGDLKQNGVSSTIIDTNGVEINANGKIGKCIEFNGSITSHIYSNNFNTNLWTECSITLWLKIVSFNAAWDTYLQIGDSNTPWNSYIVGLLRNNTNSNLVFCISNGTTSTQASFTTPNLETGTWYHIACIYKPGHCLIYINGNLHADNTTTIVPNFSSSTKLCIGGLPSAYKSKSCMNDLRIYDHALSIKEIKEISKALVCHYPLDNNGIGNINYFQNSNFYNGTANWGSVNSSSIRIEIKDGKRCITGTKGTSSNICNQVNTSYSYIGGSQVTFTISGDIYVEEVGTLSVGNWITTTQASGWQGMSGTQRWNTSSTLKVGWNHISVTRINGTNQYNGNIITAFAYTGITFWLTNVKFEFGEKDTPWCPHTSDAIYSIFNINGTTEFDTSGFKNNGTRYIVDVASDSPRYSCSTVFNGTTSNIDITDCNFSSILNNDFTVSMWIYNKDVSGRSILFGNYGLAGSFFNIEKMANEKARFYWNGNPDIGFTNSIIATNAWTFLAVTRTGNTVKCYINGVLKDTSTTTLNGTIPDNATNFRIGRDTRQNDGTPFNGYLSDFRLYATCLSASDILELYNTGASIDNGGNVLTYDIQEK